MGYYTSYNLTVTKRVNRLFNEVERETELEIAKKLCEISGWFEPSDFNEFVEKSDYPLAELVGFDVIKWYDHYEEIKALSKEFPTLYFELEGHGEDYGDIWHEYFHNGEAMHSDAKIIFETPDWEEDNSVEHNETASAVQKTLYYDTPTQVQFYDFDSEDPFWIGGIAFHNVVICGCCGATVEISDLYDEAEEMGLNEDPIKVIDWVDISDEIRD